MPRELDIRGGVVVLPARQFAQADRELTVRDGAVAIGYPPGTTAAELIQIMERAEALHRAVKETASD